MTVAVALIDSGIQKESMSRGLTKASLPGRPDSYTGRSWVRFWASARSSCWWSFSKKGFDSLLWSSVLVGALPTQSANDVGSYQGDCIDEWFKGWINHQCAPPGRLAFVSQASAHTLFLYTTIGLTLWINHLQSPLVTSFLKNGRYFLCLRVYKKVLWRSVWN